MKKTMFIVVLMVLLATLSFGKIYNQIGLLNRIYDEDSSQSYTLDTLLDVQQAWVVYDTTHSALVEDSIDVIAIRTDAIMDTQDVWLALWRTWVTVDSLYQQTINTSLDSIEAIDGRIETEVVAQGVVLDSGIVTWDNTYTEVLAQGVNLDTLIATNGRLEDSLYVINLNLIDIETEVLAQGVNFDTLIAINGRIETRVNADSTRLESIADTTYCGLADTVTSNSYDMRDWSSYSLFIDAVDLVTGSDSVEYYICLQYSPDDAVWSDNCDSISTTSTVGLTWHDLDRIGPAMYGRALVILAGDCGDSCRVNSINLVKAINPDH